MFFFMTYDIFFLYILYTGWPIENEPDMFLETL